MWLRVDDLGFRRYVVSAACILSWVGKSHHLLEPPMPIRIEIIRPYQGAGVFLGA